MKVVSRVHDSVVVRLTAEEIEASVTGRPPGGWIMEWWRREVEALLADIARVSGMSIDPDLYPPDGL